MIPDGQLVALARRIERHLWTLRGLRYRFRRWAMLPEESEWVPGRDQRQWMVSGRPGDRTFAVLDGMVIHHLRTRRFDSDAITAYAMAYGERRKETTWA